MRRAFKSILKYFINQLLSSSVVEQKAQSFFDNRRLNACLKKILNTGAKFDTVYDIGARGGDWSRSVCNILDKSQFYLFEANESCGKSLAKGNFKYFIGVLSSEIKKVLFYENNSTGDSYYRENSAYYEKVIPKERITTTLDTLIIENGLPLPDFIKLDTQGSELDILKGGARALSNATLVYMECSLLECNEGAPTINDYLGFMTDHEFVPYEICEQHVSQGALAQIDIMFMRRSILICH